MKKLSRAEKAIILLAKKMANVVEKEMMEDKTVAMEEKIETILFYEQVKNRMLLGEEQKINFEKGIFPISEMAAFRFVKKYDSLKTTDERNSLVESVINGPDSFSFVMNK